VENEEDKDSDSGRRRKVSGTKKNGKVYEPESMSDSSGARYDTTVDSTSEDYFQKIPPVHPELQRLRSESSTRVSRSSSAPQQDRPKVESVSLSRSCSEPKEPKKFLRKTSKGEIITEGLPLANDCRTSMASSSFSTDDPKSESEMSSNPSLQNSLELSTSLTTEDNAFDSTTSPKLTESYACAVSDNNEPCSPVSDVSSSFESRPDDDDYETVQSGRPVTRSVSAPAPLKETRPHSVSCSADAVEGTGVVDDRAATFPRRGNRNRTSPGLKALQSLSESLEISLK